MWETQNNNLIRIDMQTTLNDSRRTKLSEIKVSTRYLRERIVALRNCLKHHRDNIIVYDNIKNGVTNLHEVTHLVLGEPLLLLGVLGGLKKKMKYVWSGLQDIKL